MLEGLGGLVKKRKTKKNFVKTDANMDLMDPRRYMNIYERIKRVTRGIRDLSEAVPRRSYVAGR